jgi:hypothetical protein
VYLRILLNLDVLAKQGFKEESEELKISWRALFDSHAMPEFVDDTKPIVESLIVGPYPELGNVALMDVLSFSRPNYVHATDAADSLLRNGPLDNVEDVRELYAAARCAFAKEAESYERQNIQASILNKILENREAGVRGDRRNLGSFDERDKLAGRNLFEKLQMLSSPRH